MLRNRARQESELKKQEGMRNKEDEEEDRKRRRAGVVSWASATGTDKVRKVPQPHYATTAAEVSGTEPTLLSIRQASSSTTHCSS